MANTADGLDLSAERFAALFSLGDGTKRQDDEATTAKFEAWLPYVNAVISGPAARSLDIVLAAVRAAPSSEDLSWLGMTLLEPLLDLHSAQIFDQFERLARKDQALRTALGGALLDIRPSGKRRGSAGRQYEARAQRLLDL